MLTASRYNVAAPLPDGTTAVYNTRSGSCAVVDDDTRAAIERGSAGLPEEWVDALYAASLLVDAERDELAEVIAEQHAARADATRLELTLVPTLSCNLRCTYCTEAEKPPVSMTREDEARLVDFVTAQLDGVRELSVTWFGGEPLARPGPILRVSEALIRACSFRGISYRASVVTNGVLLDESLASQLRRAQVRAVRITVDGPRDLHDLLRPTAGGRPTYDRVLAGVEVARRYFRTTIGINVGRSNAHRVDELLRELAARGWDDVEILLARTVDPDLGDAGAAMPRARGIVLTVEEFARHETRLLKLAAELGLQAAVGGAGGDAVPCSAVKPRHFVVEPGGVVKRCYTEVTDATKAVGSIGSGAYVAGPRDEPWMTHELIDDGCHRCAFLPMCHGGCPKLRMNGLEKEREVCTPRRFNLVDLLAAGLL